MPPSASTTSSLEGRPHVRRADALAELVLEASMDGLVDHDLVSGMSTYSPRWLVMLGFEDHGGRPLIAPGDHWLTLAHPDDRAEVERLWKEHLEQQWPFQHTLRMRFHHGGWRWLVCRSQVLRDGPTPVRAVSLFSDATEQIDAERRQRALLTAIPDSILRIATDGTVRDLRPGSDAIGELLAELPPGSGGLREAILVSAAAAVGTGAADIRMVEVGVAGRTRYVELRTVPSGADEVVCILRDLTARRELEARLLQKQNLESIGGLAAGVAHEINTPLQYVADNLAFLKSAWGRVLTYVEAVDALSKGASAAAVEWPDASRLAFIRGQAPAAVEQAAEGIARVALVIRALKIFAEPGASGPVAVDVNAALETALTVCSGEWRAVADLVLDLDRRIPPVAVGSAELHHTLAQIVIDVSRALRARPAGGGKGMIRVETRATAQAVEVRFTHDDPARGEAGGESAPEPASSLVPLRTLVQTALDGRLEISTAPGGTRLLVVSLPIGPARVGGSTTGEGNTAA